MTSAAYPQASHRIGRQNRIGDLAVRCSLHRYRHRWVLEGISPKSMASYNPPVIFTQLPSFTISGLLPPYVGADPTDQKLISPYPTTIDVFAAQFAVSARRGQILGGFLAFRHALEAVGIVDGLQWLNGSFCEQIEMREGRDPNDLDVVTFYKRPVGVREQPAFAEFFAANIDLFTPAYTKQQFGCDAYFVDLDLEILDIVAQTRYWYGLFSHRRATGEWKGMVEVPLGVSQGDVDAAAILAQRGMP